jgi:hypothetical protein
MKLKMHLEQEDKYQQDKSKVFLIIMGQCKSPMRNKLEALEKYKTLKEEDDVAGLMEEIRKLVYSTDNTQYEYWTMQASMKTLVNLQQGNKEALQVFANRFLKQVESTEEIWGELYPRKKVGESIEQVQKPARDAFLACLFLAGVDRNRYKSVIDELNNEFVLGKEIYPKDVPGMLKLLTNRRGAGGDKNVDAIRDGIGVSFAQTGKRYDNYRCHNCGKKGHIRRDCPKKKKNNTPSDGGGNDSDSVGSDNRSTSWNQQGFQFGDPRPWYYTGEN